MWQHTKNLKRYRYKLWLERRNLAQKNWVSFTPQQMVDLIKQFKEVVVDKFDNSIAEVTHDYLKNVTKKLPKKAKKPLTKKK